MFFSSIWYINITNYKPIKKEKAAYNNEYPVGGAERKDSLAIGRPLVHIRWLVVVDQLGEEQQIDLEKVKVVKKQWESESFWHLCLCSQLQKSLAGGCGGGTARGRVFWSDLDY